MSNQGASSLNDRPFLIRNMKADDLLQVKILQEDYLRCFPGASTRPVEVYQTLGFAGGRNIFCAYQPPGRLIGFAPMFPAIIQEESSPLPNILWMDMKVDPRIPYRDHVRESLLESLIGRGNELLGGDTRRSTQMIFQHFPFENEAVDFLLRQGFVHTESVYTLSRDLSLSIPNVLAPPGMQIRSCPMKTEGEQIAYVQARNAAFPDSPITLAEWRDFTQSPIWERGICLAIFDGNELAGSIALYWDEAQNQASDHRIGITEHVFVLPRWRGLGLGRYLVAQGLIHLKRHGLQEAQLEVKSANVVALGLYTKLGFKVERESWFLVNTL
jgi:ribosomal protein S18 acetylase RimI-like enzyme